MLRLLTAGLLILSSASCASEPPAATAFDPSVVSRLDDVIATAIREGSAPGAVVLAESRGQRIVRKAYGDRAVLPQREAMTIDTIFDMASLTKVLATAPAVMILVEQGRLALTDRVSSYLPEFAQQGKESIRLVDLMTHYSGLRPDLDLDEPWQGYDEALRRAYAETPLAPPGERFVYSDINYFLLAEIVRRVSGQSLDAFCRERIYRPLGMSDTFFGKDETRLGRIAPTQEIDGTLLRGVVHDPTSRRMGGVAGHAGLFSTVDDTARFARMILGKGELDGVRILSPLGVEAMTRPQSPPDRPLLRAIGFDISSPYDTVRGDLFPPGSFGHTGFTGTSLWIDPGTETFVILFTSRLHPDGKGSVVGLRKRVASVVAASLRFPEGLPSAAERN